MVALGRGTMREFSCLDCLMDIKGKIAARQVFRSHTPQIYQISRFITLQILYINEAML